MDGLDWQQMTATNEQHTPGAAAQADSTESKTYLVGPVKRSEVATVNITFAPTTEGLPKTLHVCALQVSQKLTC